MTTRNRMTWNQPRLPVERVASEHPAYPDEGITHPAGYEDPTQPDAYENGDTSSWAEDVHPGPYRTSLAPANPMDDGGYRHPAAQPGAPARNASMTRQAAEVKAAKCVRIAQALLGKEASSTLIEDQALDFMDLSDSRLASTLRRVEASTEDEEVLLRRMLAAEDEDSEEEGEDEEDTAKTASDARLTQVLAALQQLSSRVDSIARGRVAADEDEAADEDDDDMGAKTASDDEDEDDEDEKPWEGKKASDYEDEEAMLAQMLAEQSMMGEIEGPSMGADFEMTDLEEDPMSLDDGGFDDGSLDALYADDPYMRLAKKAEDDEEDVEEVVEVASKKASRTPAERTAATRTASLRPQPRKPSAGARTVGPVRTASNAGEMNELSSLWASAPDVSDVFGR